MEVLIVKKLVVRITKDNPALPPQKINNGLTFQDGYTVLSVRHDGGWFGGRLWDGLACSFGHDEKEKKKIKGFDRFLGEKKISWVYFQSGLCTKY